MDFGGSKRDQGQIESKGAKGEEVQKVYWLSPGGDHLPFSRHIFQTAGNLTLQEDLPENRHFGLSYSF